MRYRILRKIADGGMAEIFLAEQGGAEGFRKTVVLKRILPAFAADPAFVAMFLDEAHIASSLQHSNIVQVLDLGQAGKQYFLALEFVDGWSLEQIRKRAKLARMKLPLPLALSIVGSLLRGLSYAHTRERDKRSLGIVHRDISPQNVLISHEGEVKLADFGIAKAVGRRERSVSGVIKGKIAYMSPEQSHGHDLDARSDIFAVGTLLYLLTVGKKPFEGPTDVETLLAIRKAKYTKPSEVLKSFNPDVERLISRALRADRSKRWQSAEQMGDRIDAILAKLGAPHGTAALKRWLADLAEKDGMKPPSQTKPTEEESRTMQLGTGDLELEEISVHFTDPPLVSENGARPSRDAATRASGSRPRPVSRTRRVLRYAFGTLVALTLLGAGAWLARPYLPRTVVEPVETWVRAHVVTLVSD